MRSLKCERTSFVKGSLRAFSIMLSFLLCAESLHKLQVVGLQRCQSSLLNFHVSKRSISPGSVAECVVWGTCASLDFLEPWRLSRHLALGFASYGVLIYFAKSRK